MRLSYRVMAPKRKFVTQVCGIGVYSSDLVGFMLLRATRLRENKVHSGLCNVYFPVFCAWAYFADAIPASCRRYAVVLSQIVCAVQMLVSFLRIAAFVIVNGKTTQA